MYFVLVSFLLDIPTAYNDIAWKHGADYTFFVTYNTFLEPYSESPAENNPDRKWGTNLISWLKCRAPVQALKMRCHMNGTKFAELKSRTYNFAMWKLIVGDVNYTSLDLGDASFEISREGIVNYEFNKRQEADKSFQRLYQVISNNLFLLMVDKRFGNASMGDCLAGNEAQKLKMDSTKWNDLFMFNKLHDNDRNDTIYRERQIIMNGCIIQKDYFTSNQQIHGFIPADSHITMEWTSTTVNKFNVSGPDEAPVGILYERYYSQLAQIDPVKRTLKALPNLSTLA